MLPPINIASPPLASLDAANDKRPKISDSIISESDVCKVMD
jgi:hypothetical protein